MVENAPPIEEIKKMRLCIDGDDAPIVFYCNALNVDVVITFDEKNFMNNQVNLNAKVQYPWDYLQESNIDRKKIFKRVLQ